MRAVPIVPGEYYHIFNRGNNKQSIFFDEENWIRFVFLILYLQSPVTFTNQSRQIRYFVRHRVFNISDEDIKEIMAGRYVELVAFTLMPNHFHLLLKETQEKGTAVYMQRVLNAYTKYINAKRGISGHLFQGPFKAVRVENNEQLLYLSSYIHRNPRELKEWRGKESLFPWSSCQDYIDKNRWGKLLARDIILDQFKNIKEYRHFCETSPAKKLGNELALEC